MVNIIFEPFRLIFKQARLFFPVLLVMELILVVLVGLPEGFDEVIAVFSVLVGLMLWLATIFLVRRVKAGRKVGVRDALFTSTAPLLSSVVVLMVAVIQCLPIGLLVVAYSAAVETNFLATTGYAVMFLIFAVGMVAITGFLLSSTVIALVAVSAPGLYPLEALKTAGELVKGRRVRVIFELLAGAMVATVMCGVAVWLASLTGVLQVVAVVVAVVGGFSIMYLATYDFLMYRRMLDDKK